MHDDSSGKVVVADSSKLYTGLVHGLAEMCGEFGEEFYQLVLLTRMSVREKQRRAQSKQMRHGNDYGFTAGVAGVRG